MRSTAGSTVPLHEAERLAAVRRYDILDTPADGTFDRVTRLAARIFDVPIAIVSIVDHDRIWFKSHHGIDVEQVDREPGLCASAILHDTPWIVADAKLDPRTLTNPLVRGELGLRFYAGVPLRTRDGYNLGTLNVIDREPREVTEQELAALEDLAAIVVDELEVRLAARGETERLNRARADFIVTASHELRTPLAAVYGAAKLLEHPGLEDGQRGRLLSVIAEESERLSVVVGEILTGAQLEAGQIELVSERVDPLLVVARAVEAARVHLPANLSLEHVEAGLLPDVESDGGRIRQILASLIDNAVKYSPEGGRIEVGAESRDAGVRFRVSDEGLGVPAEEVDRIFEKFVRIATRQARAAGGTGLGLYIARELARALGGSVECLPHDDRGATFVLDLPAVPPGSEPPAA